MQTVLGELADIDRRLDDAIVQLREQQAMVAIIDCEREDQAVLLSLLSSVLEQFYSLQNHRKAVLKRDPARPLDGGLRPRIYIDIPRA
jgi:hypothetical protein